MKDTPLRKIIHIDMDAFYASVEQRDDPVLRGKPVAVGGTGNRGVVAAASYEARQYGVHSAMPSITARRKCPDLIFVKARFNVYRSISNQIRDIFHEYTDLVEPLSLDEAYLDVTHNKKGYTSAIFMARQIRYRVWEETSLTASAGVSFNKFLAKTASDINKPNGMAVILPDEAEAFVEQLPIHKFYGIGKVTAGKFHQMGVENGRDLKKISRLDLVKYFGKAGRHYYNIVRLQDDRDVQPHRIRKSVGAENTYSDDLEEVEELKVKLEAIAQKVSERMASRNIEGKTVTVKIKYFDFTQQTRSKTFPAYIGGFDSIYQAACELISDPEPEKPVRLLGITVSNLNTGLKGQSQQMTFDF